MASDPVKDCNVGHAVWSTLKVLKESVSKESLKVTAKDETETGYSLARAESSKAMAMVLTVTDYSLDHVESSSMKTKDVTAMAKDATTKSLSSTTDAKKKTSYFLLDCKMVHAGNQTNSTGLTGAEILHLGCNEVLGSGP